VTFYVIVCLVNKERELIMILLKVNLYNGDSDFVKVDDELKEYLKFIEENNNYKKGVKDVWLGEEEMFISVGL
jgi:hypothetical protein